MVTCDVEWTLPNPTSSWNDTIYLLGEYSHGYNKSVSGDFKPGTNSLNAFEACVECGACSEQKFYDSVNDIDTGHLVLSYVIFFLVALVCFCPYCLFYLYISCTG